MSETVVELTLRGTFCNEDDAVAFLQAVADAGHNRIMCGTNANIGTAKITISEPQVSRYSVNSNGWINDSNGNIITKKTTSNG